MSDGQIALIVDCDAVGDGTVPSSSPRTGTAQPVAA
jgi:hypothetical protein